MQYYVSYPAEVLFQSSIFYSLNLLKLFKLYLTKR